jgi:hypothetical protein
MSLSIRRLVCVVTVKGVEKKSPLNKDAKAARPDLQFRSPPARQAGQAGPSASESATEGKGSAAGKEPVSAAGVDPSRVAERVYELMKAEVRLARMRGEGGS